MRLIDADALHETLKTKQKWVVRCGDKHNEGYTYDQVHFAIDDAPTIEERKWIPCNERLPENDDFVIVTVLDEQGDTPFRYSDFGWYLDRAECWIVDAAQRTDIIAWMALPKPYAERKTDETQVQSLV